MTPLEEVLASIAHVMFPGDDVSREIRLDTRADDGDSPLHVFAWRKDVEAASLLIEAGADPNAAGDMGETPLHVAVTQELPQLAERLLAAGASPDIVSEFEETPRDKALRKGGELAALFSRFGT
jgi:ankyrin repeat protein